MYFFAYNHSCLRQQRNSPSQILNERILPMNITGIIAEYNPFHNGHAYQLKKARELTDADYLIVVMSGDFVQRGTPAILEKHLRARAALENGADLVLELPVRYSTASAMDFASGAVKILDALNCVTHLCFGSESGTLAPLTAAAELLECEPPEYREALQSALREGLSYPLARQNAFESVLNSPEQYGTLLKAPNNILGIEYLRALLRLNSTIHPITIERTSDNYHQKHLEDRFASATAVRTALLNGRPENTAEYVPPQMQNMLETAVRQNALLTEDDFSLVLRYQLQLSSPDDLAEYLDVPRSLANRIFRLRNEFTGFRQFADLLKTKELTRTRINRSLLHILLRLKATPQPLSHIRILGFRKEASPLLTCLKKNSDLLPVTRLTALPEASIAEDLFASSLYHAALACRTGIPQPEERTIPVVII